MKARYSPKHLVTYQQEMLDWYSGSGKWGSMPYDPTHLVELARAHAPTAAEALARCTRIWQLRPEYTYCMDPRGRTGTIGNILLPMPGGGCWLVDLHSNEVVHGFEWLDSNPEEWIWELQAQRSREALRVVYLR